MPTPVVLHLYDLSQGMARSMSMALIGKQLDGIWHSGIAVFGVEYFFGGGICAAPAGRAIPHLPYQEIHLGETAKTQIELETFLQSVNHRFTQATYSLLRHNCNNFANEVASFLLDRGIPEHIIRLPQEFLTSPLGTTLAPMIEGMEQRMRSEMVGQGRGLNPFSHVQGRTLLFPDQGAAESSTPVVAVDPLWLDADVSLLKTAVDGIPISVMPGDIKAMVLALDSSSIPQLVDIISSQFKPVTPVLLTFSTIVRFFWKFEQFRVAMTARADNTLEKLITACLESENPHVLSAGLAAATNVSAAMDQTTQLWLAAQLVPHLIRTAAQQQTQGAQKHLMTARHNCLIGLDDTDPQVQAALSSLLADSLTIVGRYKSLEDQKLVPLIARSVEVACKRIIEMHIKCNLEEVDQAVLINAVEEIDSSFKIDMPNTIMLILE